MSQLTDALNREFSFKFAAAERKATRFAEAWADFNRLSEDEQCEVVDEYMQIALEESRRLSPIVDAMIEAVEALETLKVAVNDKVNDPGATGFISAKLDKLTEVLEKARK